MTAPRPGATIALCALLVACGRSELGLNGSSSFAGESGGSLGSTLSDEGEVSEPLGDGGRAAAFGSGGALPSGGVPTTGGNWTTGGSGGTSVDVASGASPAESGGAPSNDGSGGSESLVGVPCDPTMAEFESPSGSGQCVVDPCRLITCVEGALCIAQEDRTAYCQCDDGWEGPNCDYRWHQIRVPPFPEALQFDSEGNAWFKTTKGLLYWNLSSTPENTADDSFAIFPDLTGRPELAIDSTDRLWLVSGKKLIRFDPAGTPGDPSDDELLESELPISFFDQLLHLTVDSQDRVWTVARADKGVRVLGDPSGFAADTANWIQLFAEYRVLALAPEGNGIWLATEEGLRYVDLGVSLSSEADDTWTNFFDIPLIQDQQITDIVTGPDGTKWLNTEQSVVTLQDGGAPFDKSGHTWSSWSPPAAVLALGDGPILQLAPDGTPWLFLPSGSAVRASAEGAATQYAPGDCPLYPEADALGVSSIRREGNNQFWVTANDNGYLFFGGETPNDAADDSWFVTRKNAHQPFGGSVPEPSLGRWVMTLGRSLTPGSCSGLLYYSWLGEPENAWDDQWTLALPFDGVPGCFSLAGVDDREQVWINFSWMGYHSTSGLDGPAFLTGSREEALVSYSNGESEMVSGPISFALGSDRPIFSGRPFSSGASLTDKSDDEWGPLQNQALGTPHPDSLGYSWFTTGAGSDPALQRFDDRGTPGDHSDDEFLFYSGSEQLPITLATWLWIDDHDWKWLNGVVNGEFQMISFNDGGSPYDLSDDEWRSYEQFEAAHGEIWDIENADASGLWISTNRDFGILELKR